MTAAGKPHINQSVTSVNQSGGVTAHTVIVSAPQPSVSIGDAEVAELTTEDGYVTRVPVHLDDPYAAGNVAVLAQGPSVERVAITRVDPGASLVTHGVSFDGGQGVVAHAPLTADYVAHVFTENVTDDLHVEARLNVQTEQDS